VSLPIEYPYPPMEAQWDGFRFPAFRDRDDVWIQSKERRARLEAFAGRLFGRVGSLLLGLYDRDGLLHHVGVCSGLSAKVRKELTATLERIRESAGFTGRAPGGPSRWSTERSAEWEPLRPALVVEVGYDHVSGERFRHGTRFLRWRPDKAPRQCTMEQIA
jgi:ATP-dependent DNA ligase